MVVWLLGKEYDAAQDEQKEAFLEDFRSRILLTYRRGLTTPLKLATGSTITSDAGWGCMLRTMQMMLAQCFVSILLGREWRFDESRDLQHGSVYLEIISCFLDTPKAPLSLHRFVAAGQQLLGKETSSWFGPTSAAQTAGHLFLEASASDDAASGFIQRLGCVVFDDGAIFKDEVLDRFDRNGDHAIILLICRRLGRDYFNVDEYREGVEACFRLPEFQGLASGNSGSSAHFFMGAHGDDSLLYMDPHTVQPALESVSDAAAGSSWSSGLRPERPLPLHWARLNPSVCLGFLVRSRSEFLKLCECLCEGPCGEVFEVLQTQPKYAERDIEVETTEEGDMVVLA
eukprot:CAMPEP_0117507166 /NCGR_PEP_ID=MMETSP0784-20121206/26287_1 /TAXON_ID=39447 /ORGANISM="" /LENGTH=342 /DNA_ID=CAMNT_0005302669 /DNA_START=137 /DNA_END=1165 /DNA_ORIENTATION=+